MDALAEEGAYEAEIVTELEPLEDFYEAEEYHQDYFLDSINFKEGAAA